MSSSTVRSVKHTGAGGVAKLTIVPKSKASRITTPLPEKPTSRCTNPVTGKENVNFIRTAAKPQKPLVPPVVDPRGRRSTSVSVRPRGRSSSPSEFNRITSDVRKPRVSLDRNERSVSVDRYARVSDSQHNNKSTSVANLVKNSDISKELKLKHVKTQNARVSVVPPKNGRVKDSGSSSVPKVSETVKLFEKFRSKSCVRSRSDGLKEKGTGEDSLSAGLTVKYQSELHGKLAFLEEKVKRIALDIKRTKEMLDLNNSDASEVMLSGIQESVAGIEKAMCDVVSDGPFKESSDAKSSVKGLNTDEIEARSFPHCKLLRDRSTLKAPIGSREAIKTEVVLAVPETKQESKVTVRGGLEMNEVEETDNASSSKEWDVLNTYNGESNVEKMLTAHETLEECDEEENKAVMIYCEEIDDGLNNQLNEIGHKNSTGGWFVSEGESVLLAHDDGSCTFYDVANSEEKSTYKPPIEVSTNMWRDCWIIRAPGADGCSGRYVVATSAGNSMDAGFCSWDFYTKELKSFHIEDEISNTRTALAPLPNNVINRRHDLTNLTPENRQSWYKPCGPLIISTASNQKGVKIYDVRDGEHILKWDLQGFVSSMENSSPLQWRNREKVVLAETDVVSLWDVGSLTPQPLVSVSVNGKKISALHVNNTDAELGGGVRQRVSSSEAEGNDGVLCTSDSIIVLDFRHPAGVGLKISKHGTTMHSVFSHGDSIYLGCSGPQSAARKPPPTAQIQQYSLRTQKLFTTYNLPESNAHPHGKAITQVWGNSNIAMGVCGSGLFVFDALKDDGSRSDHGSGQKVKQTIGPDNLYCPSFDYLGSRALLISRDRPAYFYESVMNISHHHPQSEWSTDFGDCVSHPATCFITCCLPCVTFGQIAEMVDEGQSSCVAQGCIYGALWLISCHWVYAFMFREKLRAKYGLPPVPCNDCCVHFCCHGCALCQEHAELKHRGLDPTIGWIGPPNVPPRMPPSMHRV